ncbi:hypothetical protein QTP88_001526 [Uroleucon formosanum]
MAGSLSSLIRTFFFVQISDGLEFDKSILLAAMQTYSYLRINSANNNESRIIRTQQKNNLQLINKKIQLYNDNQIDRYNFVKSLASANAIH